MSKKLETKNWLKGLSFLGRTKRYYAHIDKFMLIGRFLYVEGWTNYLDPAIHYDGKSLPFSVTRVERPDLESHFPVKLKPRSWGFCLCAIVPTAQVDCSKFKLRLNTRTVYDNPAAAFVTEEDKRYNAMVERFIEAARDPDAHLLEIGSRARSGNTYRHLFPSVGRYTGVDIVSGPNVDVVADAHDLSSSVRGPFDLVFSISTFEHILMPWKVAIEMNRVMSHNGLGLIISHSAWPLHEEPWDYWRFSKDAWQGIFNRHTGFTVLEAAYQHQASVTPVYVRDLQSHLLGSERTYLMSACLVRKTGESRVCWDASVGELGLKPYEW